MEETKRLEESIRNVHSYFFLKALFLELQRVVPVCCSNQRSNILRGTENNHWYAAPFAGPAHVENRRVELLVIASNLFVIRTYSQ
jgi:hypothetical protein